MRRVHLFGSSLKLHQIIRSGLTKSSDVIGTTVVDQRHLGKCNDRAILQFHGDLKVNQGVQNGTLALGEFGEKGLTLLGSIFVAYAHFKNHQACN